MQKGGKKKSSNQGKGRPKKISNTETVTKTIPKNFIPLNIVPAPITKERIDTQRFISLLDHLLCPICKDVMYQPVQGPCEHSYCYNCLENYFVNVNSVSAPCPVCKTILNVEDIHTPHRLLLNLLKTATVRCRMCKREIPAENLDNHERDCCHYTTMESEEVTDVFSVLKRPLDHPLDEVESHLATRLIKRMKANSSSNHLTLKTGGTVSSYDHWVKCC